jgi:hypothetical protein
MSVDFFSLKNLQLCLFTDFLLNRLKLINIFALFVLYVSVLCTNGKTTGQTSHQSTNIEFYICWFSIKTVSFEILMNKSKMVFLPKLVIQSTPLSPAKPQSKINKGNFLGIHQFTSESASAHF